MKSSSSLPVLFAGAATLFIPCMAMAQDDQAGFGDIVVTAQKRTQSLNDVGLSINVRSGDELRNLGVSSTSDLSKVVPALNVSPSNVGLSGAPIYTLRGVGFAEHSLSALSAVSVYQDEVPLSYPYMTAGPLIDIERVEVLKGPQGTLYGQNSTGGAINYVTRQPTDAFQTGGEASYGRFNRYELEGYVSGPITDGIKARLAVKHIGADGWQKSVTRSGDRLGSVDQWAGRFQLDWDVNEAFRLKIDLNGWRDRSETLSPQIMGVNPAIPAAAFEAFYPYASAVGGGIINGKNIRDTDWTPGLNLKNRNWLAQGTVRLEGDITDAIMLTSISSLAKLKVNSPHDIDSLALDLNQWNATGTIRTFNQEIRLSGKIGSDLNWIIGGNYANDRINGSDYSLPVGTSVGVFSGLTGVNAIANSQRVSQALFANVDYDITRKLSFTGGVRYTDIKLDYQGCSRDLGDGTFAALLGGGTAPGECATLRFVTGTPGSQGLITTGLKENNVSWRAGLNYKPVHGVLLYGNVSRGYKSGDIPMIVATSDIQLQPVVQEKLTAYEVGIKAQINRQLQINAAAFHYDYRNKQLYAYVYQPLLDTIVEQTINIPKSRVNGAEIEVNWRPLDGLSLRSGVGYTDSKILRAPLQQGISTSPTYPVPANFVGLSTVDVTGDAFNLAPKWQINLDAQYDFNVGGGREAFVGSSMTYASKTSPAIGADDSITIDAHTLLDVRAGIRDESAGWRASIWGRNVTGERYTVAILRGFDVTQRFNGMPVTYGITLGFDLK